jgi:hypothetical protein
VSPSEAVPGRGPCPSERPTPSGVQFDPERFRNLSPDGRRLITGWASRADHDLAPGGGRERPSLGGSIVSSRNAFEAFIFAWISVNGWAACCCDEDRDRVLINVLRNDESVSTQFGSLVDSDPRLAGAVDQFRALWPIFRATDVRGGFDEAARTYRGDRQARPGGVLHGQFPECCPFT